jgi:hypothetical protein
VLKCDEGRILDSSIHEFELSPELY